MNRIDELRETWEKAYKGLIKDLGNGMTFEDVACMFFELGWRAADESMIDKFCDEVCVEHEAINNGWTEITPDNVGKVRKTDVGRLMIAVITHGVPYYMEYREMFSELTDMAKLGGYYYYVLPELKLEE